MARRNFAISWIRFLSMSMIVMCHFFQHYGSELAWWFNVGVEVFFIISGFLYGQKEINDSIDFYRKRTEKIIPPFWIYLFLYTLFMLFVNRSYISIRKIFDAFLGSVPYRGLEHLWFIPYILFCYFITPLLETIKKRTVKNNLTRNALDFLICIFILELLYHSYKFYFQPYLVACYVAGYFLGSGFLYWGGLQDKQNRFLHITLFCSCVALVLNSIRIYIKYFSSCNVTGNLFNIYEHYSHVALGIAIFCICFLIFRKSKNNGLLYFSDKFSYDIYIVHHFIINSNYSILNYLRNPLIGVSVSLIVILLMAIVLNKINNIFSRYILGKIKRRQIFE